MTTNKPEVVAWRWRKPVVNDQGETVGATDWELGDAPEFLPWWTNDPLIRLRDYEALQAECERLRRDADRYHRLRTGGIDDIAVVRGLGATDYGMSAVIGTYSEEIDGDVLDEVIDASINSNHENQQTYAE